MSAKTKRIILWCLIGLNLAVIWGNSAMTGQESGDLSGSLLALISKFLPFLAGELGHTILRKLAHFSEFACLGLLMGVQYRQYRDRLSPALLGLGLAASCIDETIQIYVPGRGSSLIDVWIDTSGFAAGLALCLIGYTIIKHNNIRRNQL